MEPVPGRVPWLSTEEYRALYAARAGRRRVPLKAQLRIVDAWPNWIKAAADDSNDGDE